MTTSAPSVGRRHDADWLRIIAILTVFGFHCCMFFTPVDWHMKNNETSMPLFLVVVFLDAWIMPLFFLLSGLASYFALARRTPGQYLAERCQRLLLPIYTVGIVLLVPQYFWELQTHGHGVSSFWSAIPEYLATLSLNPASPFFLAFWSGHLWFLRFLFTISVVALPVLLLLRRPFGERLGSGLCSFCGKKRGLLLFLALFALSAGLLQPHPGRHSWSSMFFYLLFFLLGALFAGNESSSESLVRRRWQLFAAGCVSYLVLLWGLFSGVISPLNPDATPLGKFVGHTLLMANRSFWVLTICGFAARHLRRRAPAAELSTAVLPFYILHQTVILLVGSWIIPLPWPIAAKYTSIFVLALTLTIGAYLFLVRPWTFVRLLFGMKSARKPAPAVTLASESIV